MTDNQICTMCKQDNPNCNRKCKECVIMADKRRRLTMNNKTLSLTKMKMVNELVNGGGSQ